jgi:hypothetical protein
MDGAPRGKYSGVESALVVLLEVYGAVVLGLLALVPRYFLPAEDATVLFEYSKNLAGHGAITFFAGGPHAEGATDFAWMALVAGAMRLGLAPLWFSAAVNVVSLVGLSAVLLRLARLRISVRRVLAVAGCVGLFPQIFAAAAGFAVLPDAMLLALLVLMATERRVGWAALVGLALCLFRPDGVVFAVPLLIYAAFVSERRGRAWAEVAAIFVAPGMLYFAWRWRYFGELFPLPFYVKSDAVRVMGLVVSHSVQVSVKYLLFDAALLVPCIRLRGLRPRYLWVCLFAIPTGFYWMMRLDQNIGDRFFYYLPLAAAILLALNWSALGISRRTLLLIGFGAWLALIAMPFYRELRTYRDLQFTEIKSLAEDLGALRGRGTMVTTETGFLTYYSGWVSYDPWGLNTAAFARHFVQPEDVERLRADVVVEHPDMSESCLKQPGWQSRYGSRTWQNMTRNLAMGAPDSEYELWLVSYGSEFYRQRRGWGDGQGDRECWFVRRDSPLHDGIVEVLGRHHGVAPAVAVEMERERERALPGTK